MESLDFEEESVFKRLYKLANPYNSQWINYIIDTSTISIEVSVDKVKRLLL